MTTKNVLRDVFAPDKVAPILREAADSYGESASSLGAHWQDPSDGRVWLKIARELEKAADKIDKIVEQEW